MDIVAQYRLYRDPRAILLAHMEKLGNVVHLSRTCTCQRMGLRYVPAKRVDFLIDQRTTLADGEHPECWMIEMGRKAGHFDGATRDRWTARIIRESQAPKNWADIVITETGSGVEILCGAHSATYPMVRREISDHEPERIVIWHWTRYFRHIPHEDMLAAAQGWAHTEWPTISQCGLAQANRSASTMLYRLSRDLGWRKLSLREQGKHNVIGQWHRADDPRLGYRNGCGQATVTAAALGCWSNHPLSHRASRYLEDAR